MIKMGCKTTSIESRKAKNAVEDHDYLRFLKTIVGLFNTKVGFLFDIFNCNFHL